MHAATIRGRAMNMLIALLAAMTFATAFAPMLGQGDDTRPDPNVMPGAICPPVC